MQTINNVFIWIDAKWNEQMADGSIHSIQNGKELVSKMKTNLRWLHPCYPKCKKLVPNWKQSFKTNSLTQRDGSRKSLDWQRESERSPCARPWQSKNQTRKTKHESFSLSCCSMDPVQWVNGQWILSGSLLKMLS